MRIKNTVNHYGIVTILFHWIMALLVIGMICLGLYMVRVPEKEKLMLIGLHKEFGVVVLLLVTLRLSWRFLNKIPTLPSTIPTWQVRSAYASHYMLYGLMFAMPITGLLETAAGGYTVSFFGWFVLPPLGSINKTLQPIYGKMHEWLAYTLIIVIVIHIGAALMHHFIDRNNVLRRMLPW